MSARSRVDGVRLSQEQKEERGASTSSHIRLMGRSARLFETKWKRITSSSLGRNARPPGARSLCRFPARSPACGAGGVRRVRTPTDRLGPRREHQRRVTFEPSSTGSLARCRAIGPPQRSIAHRFSPAPACPCGTDRGRTWTAHGRLLSTRFPFYSGVQETGSTAR